MANANQLESRNAGWRIVLKILITGVVGGIAYFLTNLVHQAQIWTVTMSIFISGVALVVQFLYDVETRLAQTREFVDRRFTEVSKATDLFAQVDRSSLRNDTAITLVQNATRINLAKDSLLAKLVQSELKATSDFLRQVVDNLRAEYPGGEHDWLFTLVQNAGQSIKATSTIGPDGKALVDEGFWTSQEARTYLAHQREAVRRRVSVRRIFIQFEETRIDEPGFQRVLRNNVDAGVDVRVLSPSGLPVGPAGALDFVLFDDEISYELSSASFPQNVSMVQSTALDLRSEQVQRRKEQFEELWNLATPYGTGGRKREPRWPFRRRRG